MTSNPETVSYWEARAVAEESKTTVEKVQTEARHRAELPALLPDEAARLTKEREALAKLAHKIEQAEARTSELVERWESMLTDYENRKAELTYGRDQMAQVNPRGVEQWATSVTFGQRSSNWSQPIQVLEAFKLLAASRAAEEAFAKWEVGRLSELTRAGSELSAFARQHGIESKLPAELQK